MHRVWLASCVVVAGCSGAIDASAVLRVEPASIDLSVDLASPPPTAAMQVVLVHADGSEDDVTSTASFELDGAPIGQLAGASVVSDGFAGGSATIRVAYAELATSIPVTAHVSGQRIVDGTPAGAAAAFATASATPFDAHLDPQDGSVLPPGLGRIVLSFAANDLDDTHQVTVTAPYLDLTIVAPGVAGPRELELSVSEVAAITRTARGGAVELEVASLQSSAPATSRVTTVGLEVADLDAGSLLVGGIESTGTVTDADDPTLFRYDMQAGGATAMFASPATMCIGCHLAVSADGTRISALTNMTTSPFLSGIILDARSGAVLAQSNSTSSWATAAYDPSGAMLGAWQGALSLRDGTTGAMIGPIATTDAAAAPTISPDGTAVAYVSLDAGGSSEPVGNALHVRSWNAAQMTVGPMVELVRDGNGVVLPEFSSDGRWVAFGHSAADSDGDVPSSSSAVRVDGSAMVLLTTDPLDQLAHWASPIAPARVGNREAEPMVWIAINSTRPVGGNATSPRQLWLEAFYPDRGVVAPAFHLPGQDAAFQVLHGPIALP
ncbi:MAG TPA: hypothetical protein VGG28_26710 [Kofleriaceae bacterium]|jgi:hypothetical protein